MMLVFSHKGGGFLFDLALCKRKCISAGVPFQSKQVNCGTYGVWACSVNLGLFDAQD